MKEEGCKVAWITTYDYPTAEIAEKAGMDMLFVGDSLWMCICGYAGTSRVTMEQCLLHSKHPQDSTKLLSDIHSRGGL